MKTIDKIIERRRKEAERLESLANEVLVHLEQHDPENIGIFIPREDGGVYQLVRSEIGLGKGVKELRLMILRKDEIGRKLWLDPRQHQEELLGLLEALLDDEGSEG
jgi:hypothetical protein